MDQTMIEMIDKHRARIGELSGQLVSIMAEIEKLAKEARGQSMEEEATILDEAAAGVLDASAALDVTYEPPLSTDR